MLRKLRIKFICVNMLIVTVMLCVIFGLVFDFTAESLAEEGLQVMRSVAEFPATPDAPAVPDAPDTPDAPHRPDHRDQPRKSTADVRLPYFILHKNPEGDLIAEGNGYFDLTDEEFLAEVAAIASESTEESGLIRQHHLRFLKTDARGLEMIIFADTSSEYTTIRDLFRNCTLIGIVSFVLFLFLSLLFSRWAIRPVEDAWNQQKQFVANASHDLKTPLTVIMTSAEMLQSGEYDDATRQQFTANILTVSRQMRGLVEGMLELARVDSGAKSMTFRQLDLSQLTEDAILPFEPLYFEKGLTLECGIRAGLQAHGSEEHLRQVVEILLDNALKYSAPGGTVQVKLTQQFSHSLLAVSNPGHPISQEDLKNIFKRFYRLDKSRSQTSGYGLGLPIAASVITAHHGKIWAESSGGVNTFFVQLPN